MAFLLKQTQNSLFRQGHKRDLSRSEKRKKLPTDHGSRHAVCLLQALVLPLLTPPSSLSDRLLFAVPKKGRLHHVSLDLLAGSDIQFHRHNRLDIALVTNLPLALVFLPAADIPTFVGEGRVDLGITGRDQVAEHAAAVRHSSSLDPVATSDNAQPDGHNDDVGGVREIMDLGFGRCKLQVQVPVQGTMTRPEQLLGRNVVTSFTHLTQAYFQRLEAEQHRTMGSVNSDSAATVSGGSARTRVKYVGGSVEAACALGVADGIVDLVGAWALSLFLSAAFASHSHELPESGETMRAAGLHAIATVLESTAVLIGHADAPPTPTTAAPSTSANTDTAVPAPDSAAGEPAATTTSSSDEADIAPLDRARMVHVITHRLRGVITAQRYVLVTYNVPRELLAAAIRITPGKRAPTVNSLEEAGWVALSCMVERAKVAGVMDELAEVGATDILVTKIENSRTTW